MDYKNKKAPYDIIPKKALWDTGATGSVITAATAKELKLTAVGSATVNHVDGQSKTSTYLVNLFLPNRVAFPGVLVSECKDSDFGVIIGMDIITQGDFAITNLDSKTWLSFRIPSTQAIDYVADFKLQQKAK
jgi:predicted aspartyl protease